MIDHYETFKKTHLIFINALPTTNFMYIAVHKELPIYFKRAVFKNVVRTKMNTYEF